MSRTFSGILETDLQQVFLNTDEFAVEVTIVRGTRRTAGVVALVASRTYEAISESGFATSISLTDFDLQASSYVIGGQQVSPAKGDRIIDASGYVHEVRAKDDSSPWYEPIGSGNDLIRVHTQRVKT